jgi:hypothetical protein
LLAITALTAAASLSAQDTAAAQSAPAGDAAGTTLDFGALADKALGAMVARAQELKMHGAAVVAYAKGDHVNSWSSKMMVVGTMTNPPSGTDKGANLLGIAYAKAAEMALTLSNSGSATRPPLTGEFGWKGGVVGTGGGGTFFAAFSGGRSEDDVLVSKAGLEVLMAGH